MLRRLYENARFAAYTVAILGSLLADGIKELRR